MTSPSRQRRSADKLDERRDARELADVLFQRWLGVHGLSNENARRAYWSRLRELCDQQLREMLSEAEKLRRTQQKFTNEPPRTNDQ